MKLERPTKEQFLIAYNLVANHNTWTTGAWARDVDYNQVDYNDPAAVCFCSDGAMQRAGWKSSAEFADIVNNIYGSPVLPWFNDNHSYVEVKAVWTKISQAWGYI